MKRRQQGLSARVRAFLIEQGQPVSSARLMEMFLKMAPLAEPQATRLMAPVLEPEGLTYRQAEGWSAPAHTPAGGAMRRVAAVPDPASGAVVLAVADEREGARLLRPEEAAEGMEAMEMVVLDARRDGLPLRAWLRRSRLPVPGGVTTLRATLRGRVRLKRASGLAEAAAALGIRWSDAEDARSTALAMAACLRSAEALAADAARPETDARAPAWSVHPEDVRSLPSGPGTYRLLDGRGRLLYVGKARDLRRRVSSYAARRAGPGHGDRFIDQVARVEHREEGSELEALLAEARLIARRNPPGNVQKQVHERPATYDTSRAWALLLPCRGRAAVSVVVVREGRYLGHVAIGPRGGGLPAARRLLVRALSRARTGGAPRGQDRETSILNSWLAVHGDGVSRLELDTLRGVGPAVTALKEAVASVRREPGRVVFRGR
ncbi:MAG: nucleotide excision repair endonuclease [Candidatus Polarisedimenticolia bacterium]